MLHQIRRRETPIGVFRVILASATHAAERKHNTNYYDYYLYLYYGNNHNDYNNDNNKTIETNACFFTSCLGLTQTHDGLECSSFGAPTKARVLQLWRSDESVTC